MAVTKNSKQVHNFCFSRKADERKILRHFFQCLFQEDVNEIIPVIPYFYSIQARFSASNVLRDVTESKMMQDTPDATNEL